MKKELFYKYARLKQQEREIKQELDVLKDSLVEQMQEKETDEVETDLGKFVISEQRRWAYPEYLQREEDELKVRKKEAEQKGEASYEVQPVLRFFETRE